MSDPSLPYTFFLLTSILNDLRSIVKCPTSLRGVIYKYRSNRNPKSLHPAALKTKFYILESANPDPATPNP
jgi:hypothetical protein